MPTDMATRLYELAEPQHGYFTTAHARTWGIHPATIVMMERRGTVERISRGVYRLARFPVFRHGQYMEAILWPHDAMRGVLSHESALAYHELSDASPARVHITLPTRYRVRRAVPAHLVVHHADPPPADVAVLDGIPATIPERTIRDCHAAGLGDRLIRQAIDDGLDRGKLTIRQAERLRSELLEGRAAADVRSAS